MKATDFEYRHQRLIHLFIVAVSFLTYLIDPDDIVWALVRSGSQPRLLERLLFAVATLLIGVAAAMCTCDRAHARSSDSGLRSPHEWRYRYLRYPKEIGNLLFAVGLGFLAPLSGFIILVAGETILTFRLIQREAALRDDAGHASPDMAQPLPVLETPMWGKAFRQESAKWGLFLTMVIFTLLLRDRVAEVLAGASFLAWAALNRASFVQRFCFNSLTL